MTALDLDVVRRKLATIQASVAALEGGGRISLAEYQRDLWRRKGIERVLQESIEAMLDIATYLLIRLGRPAPADAYGAFLALAEAGILERDLAQALAPSAGLRNRLVHEYDALDDALVLAAVDTALLVLPRFVAAIEAWLRRGP